MQAYRETIIESATPTEIAKTEHSRPTNPWIPVPTVPKSEEKVVPDFDQYDYYDYSESNFLEHKPPPTTQYTRTKRYKGQAAHGVSDVDFLLAPEVRPEVTKVTVSNQESRNTICICCDESWTPNHYNNHAYSRRTLQVRTCATRAGASKF